MLSRIIITGFFTVLLCVGANANPEYCPNPEDVAAPNGDATPGWLLEGDATNAGPWVMVYGHVCNGLISTLKCSYQNNVKAIKLDVEPRGTNWSLMNDHSSISCDQERTRCLFVDVTP